PEPVRGVVVVGGQQPTFAGGDVLGGVEGERPDPEAAGPATVERGAVGLGGVLDHGRSVRVGQDHEGRHVGHQAVEVDGDDGGRVLAGHGGDGVGVDGEVGGDVGEAHRRPGAERGIDGGGEG